MELMRRFLRMLPVLAILMVTGFLCVGSSAESEPAPGMPPMVKQALTGIADGERGYTLDQFKGFEKDWNLVTVRYREDTGEMRFTYANDLAWKTLQEGGEVFPDGSAFAKIGYITEPDLGFVASLSPTGTRRYQLMVKDSKRHAETDGWGYALFQGMIPDQDVSTKESQRVMGETCHACHRLVPERDYVFSLPIQFDPGKPMFSTERVVLPNLAFKTEDLSVLPENARKQTNARKVRLVQGEMTTKLFGGTMNEIKPMLIHEALESGLPAGLMGMKKSALVLVIPQENGDCPTGSGQRGKRVTVYSMIPGTVSGQPAILPYTREICASSTTP